MRIRTRSALACLAGLACAGQGQAADRCAGVDAAATEARKQAYAPLVAGALTAGVTPAEVEILDFLRQGDWIVVGAEVPVADGEGFFFFQKVGDKLRFHDVWGGFADASETAEVAGWATALGAPAALSACFASKAVSG